MNKNPATEQELKTVLCDRFGGVGTYIIAGYLTTECEQCEKHHHQKCVFCDAFPVFKYSITEKGSVACATCYDKNKDYPSLIFDELMTSGTRCVRTIIQKREQELQEQEQELQQQPPTTWSLRSFFWNSK